jgi:hypothetical protein
MKLCERHPKVLSTFQDEVALGKAMDVYPWKILFCTPLQTMMDQKL